LAVRHPLGRLLFRTALAAAATLTFSVIQGQCP
jgi:hypothetical protein